MDLESLKMLLEVEAGSNVTAVAVTYFASYFLIGLLIVITILLAARMIIRAVVATADATSDMRRWRDALGTGVPGYLAEDERARTVSLIDQLVRDHVERKDKQNRRLTEAATNQSRGRSARAR